MDNFISITGWLLGPSATKVLRLLPSIIGKITLSIYEVERVRHALTKSWERGGGGGLGDVVPCTYDVSAVVVKKIRK